MTQKVTPAANLGTNKLLERDNCGVRVPGSTDRPEAAEPIEESAEFLRSRAAVRRALEKMSDLDIYDLSGQTGVRLSMVEAALRSLTDGDDIFTKGEGRDTRYSLRRRFRLRR
jgi:hypothetical protein